MKCRFTTSCRSTILTSVPRHVRASRCSFHLAAYKKTTHQLHNAGQILDELKQAGAIINVAIAKTPQHGLGLIWAPQTEDLPQPALEEHQDACTPASGLLVASIPGSHILSYNIPGACPELQLQPGLAALFTHGSAPVHTVLDTDSTASSGKAKEHAHGASASLLLSTAAVKSTDSTNDTSNEDSSQQKQLSQTHAMFPLTMDGQLRNAALLLWVVLAGDSYLDGFWARYAATLLPAMDAVMSLLTYTPAELRILKDDVLMHANLSWREQVRRCFEQYINTPAFHQGLQHGCTATWQQWVWAVACVESRAYGFKVGSELLSAFVPIWGEANHCPAAPTITRIHRNSSGRHTPDALALKNQKTHDGSTTTCGLASSMSVALYLNMSGSGPTFASQSGAILPKPAKLKPSARLPQAEDQPGIISQDQPCIGLLEEGSPVFSNYGEKSSRLLMEQYGFVIPGNTSDHVVLHPLHTATPSLIHVQARDSKAPQDMLLLPSNVHIHSHAKSQQESLQCLKALGPRWQRPSSCALATQHNSSSLLLIRRDRVAGVSQKLVSGYSCGLGSQTLQVLVQQPAAQDAAPAGLPCLLDMLILAAASQPPNTATSAGLCDITQALQWVRQQVDVFFSDAAHLRRLQAVAACLCDTYGCKSMAQYKQLQREGEVACVQQAHFCIQAWMLLSHPNTIQHDVHKQTSPGKQQSSTVVQSDVTLCSDHVKQSKAVASHIISCLKWHVQQLMLGWQVKHAEGAAQHHVKGLRPAAVLQAHLYRVEQLLVGFAAVELLQCIHDDWTACECQG